MTNSLSSIYLALSSSRRLRILSALRRDKCLPIPDLARRVNLDYAMLMYEAELLRREGLVSVNDSIICIEQKGEDVLSRLLSLDQDVLNKANESGNMLRFLDAISLRTISMYIALSGPVGTLLLLVLAVFGIVLLLNSGNGLIALFPLRLANPSLRVYATTVSILALSIYMLCTYWILLRHKSGILPVVTMLCTCLCITLLYLPIEQLIKTLVISANYKLILEETIKLTLATFATVSTTTQLSYYTGKTFENTFLITVITLLIPSIIVYTMIRLQTLV